MDLCASPSLPRLVLAGSVATGAGSVVLYGAPLLGLPPLDVGAVLVALWLNRLPLVGTAFWYLGLVLACLAGAVALPLLYRGLAAGVLRPLLPRSRWARGLLWGTLLWFLTQTFLLPSAGLGFTTKAPLVLGAVLHGFLAHALYGLVFTAWLGSAAPARD